LDTLTKLGTVYNVGTLSSGTLQYVGNIGTLPNIVLGSGTLQTLNNGTLTTVSTVTGVTLVTGINTLGTMGTLNYAGNLGTVYNIRNINSVGTLSSGTLTTVSTVTGVTLVTGINTLGTMGTLYYLNNVGTLYSVGSANVYQKHDNKVYDNIGTIMTAVGTLVQTASKVIKVHQFSVATDGTLAWSFNDIKPNGGTLLNGMYHTQREGMVQPFIQYPGYHFKTTTAGSALCLGTYAPGISGTAYIHIVYSDDDTS
jgi:hypothetical protein